METETKAMRVWITQLDTQSASTKRVYLYNLESFLTRFKIADGEALYRMKLDDLKSEDSRDRLRVEGLVKTHMVEMVRGGKAPLTACQVGKSIASFMRAQNLPLVLRRGDYPKGIGPGRRIISKEQIAQIYDRVGAEFRLRNRALIMVLKDSGLRISDVVTLDVETYLEAKIVKSQDGEEFKVFDPVLTKKSKVAAFVHLGPESIKAVDAYLEDHGAESGPLFVDRFGNRMGVTATSIQFDRLCKTLRVSRLGAHSFRKFHFTALETAGMPQNWIKLLEGKNLGQSIGAYSHPEEGGELTLSYIKAYPKLRIFGDPENSEIVETLQNTVQLLEVRLQDLEVQNEALSRARSAAQAGDRGEFFRAFAQIQKMVLPPDSPLVDIKKSPKRGEST